MSDQASASPSENAAGSGVVSRDLFGVLLDWPNEPIRVWDDGDPHGRLCLVLPGGQLVDVGCHADPKIDTARAEWMCDALNHARVIFPANIRAENQRLRDALRIIRECAAEALEDGESPRSQWVIKCCDEALRPPNGKLTDSSGQ